MTPKGVGSLENKSFGERKEGKNITCRAKIMFSNHKSTISKIIRDALAEKRRTEILHDSHEEQKIPDELMNEAGVYIRIMQDGKCMEESGSVYVVMPFIKALTSALERITYAKDVLVELNIITDIKPLVSEEQIGGHGFVIEYGPYNAVLLPQELDRFHDITAEEKLNALCKKANIHEDAWKEKSAKKFIFTCETMEFTF